MKNLEIRKAQKEDLEKCEKIIQIPEMELPDGGYYNQDYLNGYLEDGYFWLAELENKIVGLVFGEKLKHNGSVVWMIAVDEKYRKQKIGTKLLETFEKSMEENKRDWILLYGYNGEKQINWYQKNGYSKGLKMVEFVKHLKLK